tara:strand:- start:797 stop:1309 length:513 start_codon:yes stop_codon:yes gene_type:complete
VGNQAAATFANGGANSNITQPGDIASSGGSPVSTEDEADQDKGEDKDDLKPGECNDVECRAWLNNVSSRGWFRPWGHIYTVGRDTSPLVWTGSRGPGIGSFLDDYFPGAHTFGHNHDSFVDWATRLGLPDSLVNLPSMLPILWMSQWQEIVNTAFESTQPGSAPFEHFHD